MYKAVFLDLDGTLLDDKKEISKENKDAIEYVKSKDGLVIICSGRQKNAVVDYKKLADASRYVICSNGTQIYDCDLNEELYSCRVDQDISKILLDYVVKNNFYIRIEDSYARYINSKEYFFKHEIILDSYEDMLKLILEDNVLQITIGTKTEEEMNQVVDFIKSLNRKDIKIENLYPPVEYGVQMYSANIINVNASKGNAIYGLCKYLHIDINEVIAIGDDENDLSMIKMAGLGVAMGNAEEEVKKVAKVITKTNIQNGVAEILRSKF